MEVTNECSVPIFKVLDLVTYLVGPVGYWPSGVKVSEWIMVLAFIKIIFTCILWSSPY